MILLMRANISLVSGKRLAVNRALSNICRRGRGGTHTTQVTSLGTGDHNEGTQNRRDQYLLCDNGSHSWLVLVGREQVQEQGVGWVVLQSLHASPSPPPPSCQHHDTLPTHNNEAEYPNLNLYPPLSLVGRASQCSWSPACVGKLPIGGQSQSQENPPSVWRAVCDEQSHHPRAPRQKKENQSM